MYEDTGLDLPALEIFGLSYHTCGTTPVKEKERVVFLATSG
jgi:hypothetical protein